MNTNQTPAGGTVAGLSVAGGSALFRASLTKALPGYNWTVHKPISKDADLHATGIQSSGSNRCSTIEVTMRTGGKWFEAKIAGYGTRAKWLKTGCGSTLIQAIRSLQDGLEHEAAIYRSQASTLQEARTLQNTRNVPTGTQENENSK